MQIAEELEGEKGAVNNGKENETITIKLVYDKLNAIVSESAVVVFSSSECFMCDVAKHLLFSLGVGPTVIELDSITNVQAVVDLLSGTQQVLPAIFVGGKLLGGIESLISSHINGSLVPLLKDVGALWL